MAGLGLRTRKITPLPFSTRRGTPPFTSNGTFLLKWGIANCGTGASSSPVGIDVDATGTVYVTSLGQPSAIQKFSSTGSFLGEVGSPGSAAGFVYGPAAVVVDAEGRVYEADGPANRVQVFTSAGDFLVGWGSEGSGPGQFSGPIGIALGPGGEIYVSDVNNYRIEKFGDLSTPALRSTWGRLKTIYR